MTENLLKRRWSMTVLRYIARGITDPSKIEHLETGLTTAILADRLRTLVRYRLVARFPAPAPSKHVEFKLTSRGQKLASVLEIIDQLDRDD